MAEARLTLGELVQKIIQQTAGVILAAVLIWLVATTQEHDTEIAVFTSREYPPRWQREKDAHQDQLMESMREEQRRLQQQIDRLESFVPGVTGQPLPPYSFNEELNYDTQGG